MIGKVAKYAKRVDPVLLAQPSVSWRTGGNEVWKKYSQHGGSAVSGADLLKPVYARVKAAV